ncbi:MAG: AraC family transcriptional regulator [Faecalimonas sp.]|nr:AraC family transcriptional regulator [Faecalimonas sp.]
MYKPETMPTFHNILTKGNNPYICLLLIGWRKCEPGAEFAVHDKEYHVYSVLSGTGVLNLDGHSYTLSANDTFLVRPNQLALYTADMQDPWEYSFFSFSGRMANDLIQRSCFSESSVCKLPNTAFADEVKSAAIKIYEQDALADLRGLKYLFRLLNFLIPSSPQLTETDKAQRLLSPQEQSFSNVQEYIHLNYHKPIQISDVCKELNISRSYLFRLFKKYANCSVEEYILSLRIGRAKHYLSATNFPISDIANMVGYLIPASFYRMFKRIEGITPNEYRALHSEKK